MVLRFGFGFHVRSKFKISHFKFKILKFSIFQILIVQNLKFFFNNLNLKFEMLNTYEIHKICQILRLQKIFELLKNGDFEKHRIRVEHLRVY